MDVEQIKHKEKEFRLLKEDGLDNAAQSIFKAFERE